MVNNNKIILFVLVVLLAVLWGTVLLFSPIRGTAFLFSILLLSLIWIIFFRRPLLIFCSYFLIIVNLDNFVLMNNPVKVTVDIVVTSFLMVMIIYYFLVKKRNIEYASLHIFYLISLIPCFISLFVSLNVLLSVKFFFRLISYLLISLGLFNTVADKKDIRKVLTFMALSAVIPCLFGYLQHWGISFPGIVKYSGRIMEMEKVSTERIGSTLTHPVFFGLFLTVITPIVIHLFQTVYKRNTLLFICAIFVLLGSAVLSLARAPWVALLICLILYCIFMKKVKILIVICCTVLFLYFLPVVHRRWADVISSPQESSFGWRMELWKNALNLFSSRKQWVALGVGLDRFRDLSEMLGYWVKFNAHNDYIQRLIDTGVWGLVLYVLFLFYVPLALWKISKRLKDFELKNLVVWCLSLHISLLFFQMSNSIQPSQYVYYFSLITLAFKIGKLRVIDQLTFQPPLLQTEK